MKVLTLTEEEFRSLRSLLTNMFDDRTDLHSVTRDMFYTYERKSFLTIKAKLSIENMEIIKS